MTGRCIDKGCSDGPADPEDGTALPRWAQDGSMLCQRCEAHLERWLSEAEGRRDQLRSVLGGLQSRQSGENKPTKGTPPVPLNLAAHDHLTALHATLVAWSLLVREERGLRGPDRDDDGVLARWLLGQLDWLVQQPWVDDLADELRDLSRTADGLTRVHPRKHHLPAPCPDCSAQELHRLDGADHVLCLSCGLTWHEDDYARLVLVLATDKGTSVTASEAAARAKVPAGTFRRWVSEGRVRRLGTVDGLARYSTSDLDAVSQETA